MGLGWLEQAVCRQVDVGDLFFPEPGTEGYRGQIVEVKAVCAACPVRSECLEWAIEREWDAGIWGGRTPDERARIVVRRAAGDVGADGDEVEVLSVAERAQLGREAVARGMSKRRAGELFGVAPRTVARWKQQTREAS